MEALRHALDHRQRFEHQATVLRCQREETAGGRVHGHHRGLVPLDEHQALLLLGQRELLVGGRVHAHRPLLFPFFGLPGALFPSPSVLAFS